MNARIHAGLRTAATLCLAGAATACGPKPVTRSFVATIGTGDTVAVESYQRMGDTLSGMNARVYPQASVRSYKIAFGPDGAVQSVHLSTGDPGAAPTTTVDYTYTGDSVTVQAKRDTVTHRVSVATQGERPLPFYEDLFAFWNLGLERAMSGAADSTTFGTLSGSGILPVSFRKDGASGAEFGVPQWGTARAALDQAGHVDRLDMSHTTTKYDVVLVDSVNVTARAAAWAARPKPGPLSPRDTARADIGRAQVIVDYGRPAVRGRQVWGGLIPFDQVWRTGANAATQLIIDRPLVIGGKPVPAGTYSIWSEATQSGWTLIVNKQHGQWGTVYDSTQDLVRVPITRSTLPQPMERFTIAVTATGARGGTLTLAWGDVQGTVPFVVR